MFRKINPVKLCKNPLCSNNGFSNILKRRFSKATIIIKSSKKVNAFPSVVVNLKFWFKKVKIENVRIILSNGMSKFNKVLAGKSLLDISDFGASMSGMKLPITVPESIPIPQGVIIS